MADVALSDITALKTLISGTATATVSAKRQAIALNLCDQIALITGLAVTPAGVAKLAQAEGAIYAATVALGLTPGADGSL